MDTTRTKKLAKQVAAALLATAAVAAGASSAATAEPQGYIEIPFGVGYYYGTFNDGPNHQMVVGGTAQDFCDTNPDDPFMAEPDETSGRLFIRNDGSEDIKVNSRGHMAYIYATDIGDAPVWINAVCAGDETAELVASGPVDLKVRITIESPDLIDVFNSVQGEVTGTDGARYLVRASADLVVQDGVPVGSPADFVDFELRRIGR